MNSRCFRRNSKDAGVANAVTFEEVVRTSRAIKRRAKRERSEASAAAREVYLRGLLGLPAKPAMPSMRDREAG